MIIRRLITVSRRRIRYAQENNAAVIYQLFSGVNVELSGALIKIYFFYILLYLWTKFEFELYIHMYYRVVCPKFGRKFKHVDIDKDIDIDKNTMSFPS